MKRALILFLFGTAVFIACIKFFHGFFIASAIAVAAIVFVRMILKVIDRKKREAAPGFTPDQKAARDVAQEGMEKLRQINNSTIKIRDNAVAQKIKEICRIGVQIFDDINKNPDHLRKVKQFTNYYLDSTKKLIDNYAELSDKKELTPEVEAALKKIEGLLDNIKETFSKQLGNLLQDDLLDLNAEIAVLKNTMKMEG